MKKWIFLFIVIQIFIIFNSPVVEWDESVYIGIGKFIFSNGTSGLYESFRPSFLPLLIGLLWKFGVNAIFAGRLIVLLFSTLNLILFYKISKEFVPKRMATLGMIMLAITPVYFQYSTKIMTGIIASFFILLSFYLMNKNNSFWGLTAGLAVLTRFPAGIFFILFWFFSKKKFYPLVLFILAISPFFLINFYFGSGLTQPVIDALSHQDNQDFNNNILFYPQSLVLSSCFFMFSIFGLGYMIKDKKWAIVFSVIIPLIYFSLIINKQLRFANLFLPFIVLMAIYGLYRLFIRYKENKIYSFGLIIFVVISIIMSVSSISLQKDDYSNIYKTEEGNIIITSDPIFAAYSDNKFIPAYYDLESAINIMENFEADYYVYSDIFYCEDFECKIKKLYLMQKFSENEFVERRGSYLIFK